MNNKSIKVNTNIIFHVKGLMVKRYFILLLLNFSFSYEAGDYINLIDQNKEFQICYGSDDEVVKLSDFNGDLNGGMYHVIHIDMAASW